MASSFFLRFIQSQDYVDHAIAEVLQNEVVQQETSSDEVIAWHLQDMENLGINSIPDDVVPVETPPETVSWGPPNSDYVHEDSYTQQTGHNNVDPDNMSYEERQSLAENIGSESKGLSEATIASLRVSVYGGFFSKKLSHECTFCCSAPQKGEILMTLPCKHYFHKHCITTWLKDHKKKSCPVCRCEIEEK